MKKRNQLTISLIVAIVMLACACPVSGLIPGSGTEEAATPGLPFVPATDAPPIVDIPQVPASVLFTDDFSAASSEMDEYTADDGSAGTENGVYVVRSSGDLWQWGKSNSQFADTIIDVDVTMITGPSNDNAGFGVTCRLAEATDTSVSGYMLAISGDGFYTIRSIASSEMSALVDWTESSAINTGNATNHIRATCNGSDLTLEVNGEVVATANTVAGGSDFGSVAFAAISFEDNEPIAEVHFDNLVVSQP